MITKEIKKPEKKNKCLSEVTYVVLGNPIPLQRPRFCKTGVYDSQKADKRIWAMRVQAQMPSINQDALSCPLVLFVDFHMRIPVSKRKKVFPEDCHHIKPDLSNLIKFVEDACCGILYTDDKLIVECHAIKKYSTNPRTEFYLRKICNED
jgi:Holliday junction resolvase RusA-like endonuclease